MDVGDVGIRDGRARGDGVAIGRVERDAADDAADRPGREDQPVHGADVVCAEHISEEARDGAEAATVARREDEHERHERVVALVANQMRDGEDDDHLARETEVVHELTRLCVLDLGAADESVRDGGEEQTADAVEDAVDRDDVGALVRRLAEQIDAHARELGEHDEAVELAAEEHDIEHSEVDCLDGVDERELLDVGLGGRVWL